MVNIREFSVKCGNCQMYQTLAAYTPSGDYNVYSYECENDTCDVDVTRTLVEVLREVDEFAHRDPNWRGGGKHGAQGDDTSQE